MSLGEERTIIGAVGDERVFRPNELERLPDVERVVRVLNDWKIISREADEEDGRIVIRGVIFGGVKRLDITADTDRAEEADAVFVDPFYLPARPMKKWTSSVKTYGFGRLFGKFLICRKQASPSLSASVMFAR